MNQHRRNYHALDRAIKHMEKASKCSRILDCPPYYLPTATNELKRRRREELHSLDKYQKSNKGTKNMKVTEFICGILAVFLILVVILLGGYYAIAKQQDWNCEENEICIEGVHYNVQKNTN